MHLHSIIIAGLLLAPISAFAQEATPGVPPAAAAPSLSPMVPMPRDEAGVNGYRIVAIAAGALVGVVAANFLTGGMITPILAFGTGTAMEPVVMVAGPMAAEAAMAEAAMEAAAAPAAVAAVPPAAPAAAVAVEPVVVEAAGVPEMMANAAVPVVATVGYAYRAGQAAAVAAGAIVGGYVGNWFYGK